MENKNKAASNASKNKKNTDFVSVNTGFGPMNTRAVSENADFTSANTDDPMSKALSLAKQYSSTGTKTDPLGMWTGVPEEDGEMPAQDADDL